MSIVPRDRYEELEEKADSILREALSGITKHEEKSDLLTPWKRRSRYSHEVYNSTGVADPSKRQGTFGREVNRERPHLNSREGVAGLYYRPGLRPLSLEVREQVGRVGAGTCTGHHSADDSCVHGCSDVTRNRGQSPVLRTGTPTKR